MLKIDMHTHLMPERVPDWTKKFGYGPFIYLEHHRKGFARMMQGEKFFREIPAIRPAPSIILGGPGWDLKDAREVTFVHDLSLACDEIEGAVGF